MTSALLSDAQTDTAEAALCRQRQTEVSVAQPHAAEPPAAGRSREPILTYSLLREIGPANIWISDLSGLQDCEMTYFCCFKPAV